VSEDSIAATTIMTTAISPGTIIAALQLPHQAASALTGA
jgi:hypothetical protein